MDSLLEWWFIVRSRIDKLFLPVMSIIAAITGLLLLFAGFHVTKQPMALHLLEFAFTFSFNSIFLFGIVKGPAEEQMDCVLTFPVILSMLSFALFVVCFRVIPFYSATTPWYVSFDIAIQQRSWMNLEWILVSMASGLVIMTLTFWAVSKARLGDFIRPILVFFILSIIINAVINLFLYGINY